MVLPPASSTDTSCFMIHFLLAGGHSRVRLWRGGTVEEQEPVAFWEAGNTPFAAFFLVS
jgi:hypothetical protein